MPPVHYIPPVSLHASCPFTLPPPSAYLVHNPDHTADNSSPAQHPHANCRGIVLHSSASSLQHPSSRTPAPTLKTRRLETLTRSSRPRPAQVCLLPKLRAPSGIPQLSARDIQVSCFITPGCFDLPPPDWYVVGHKSFLSWSTRHPHSGSPGPRFPPPFNIARGPSANASLLSFLFDRLL
jgi:hypothetical protein